MRTHRFTYLIAWVAFLCGGNAGLAWGQSPFDPAYYSEAVRIREHVNLFTDRSIYAVGESLNFRADHRVSYVEPDDWSTVLYAELVTASGEVVEQGKFILREGICTGSLQIPSRTLTGLYYLKCYTRWMRNRGPESFSFTPIKIINPNRMEVAEGTRGNGYEANVTRLAYKQGEIDCRSEDSIYGRGKEVRVQISGSLRPDLDQLNCCLTVVPLGAIDTLSGQLVLPSDGTGAGEFRVDYLPDMGKGPSISGSVVLGDQTPAELTSLHFSLLGEKPDFFAVVTDAQGRFILTSPAIYGEQEYYVSPDPRQDLEIEVLIDQEFDAAPLPVPAIKFGLNQWEREIATRMALSMQLSQVYGSSKQVAGDSTKKEFLPFYGTRVQGMYMDDYVNLPTLEEVFINLIPNVDVLKKKGKLSLKIQSENQSVGVFDPLVLIDHISVFNQEAVLALSPEKIHRIDLINEIYIKGNVAFGGLISIYSKSGDMAGIDLPPGSYFFDFKAFYPEVERSLISPEPGDRIPDTRNTVFWDKEVILVKNRVKELSFQAPSNPGSYVILVRGVLPNGELLSATARFTVE